MTAIFSVEANRAGITAQKASIAAKAGPREIVVVGTCRMKPVTTRHSVFKTPTTMSDGHPDAKKQPAPYMGQAPQIQ
ncbi:hypothetical protein J25TS5_44910 [Paenibacillus faecis]|nr:hypothetical protein J25TS5_44910 [Paenibacillus faecis]